VGTWFIVGSPKKVKHQDWKLSSCKNTQLPSRCHTIIWNINIRSWVFFTASTKTNCHEIHYVNAHAGKTEHSRLAVHINHSMLQFLTAQCKISSGLLTDLLRHTTDSS